jgi:WD40 repeat protein
LSQDGKMLAAACGQEVRVWAVPSGRELMALPGHQRVGLAVLSPDDTTLASTDVDGTVRIWRIGSEEGQLIDEIKPADLPPAPGSASKKKQLGAYRVAFSPDGKWLAWSRMTAGRGDEYVHVWDLAKRKRAGSLLIDGHVEYVGFSSDGDLLKTIDWKPGRAGYVHEVQHWSTSSFQRKGRPQRHPLPFRGAQLGGGRVFSSDGRLRAELSVKGQRINLTDLTTGRSAFCPGLPPVPPQLASRNWGGEMIGVHAGEMLTFSPDNKTLALGMNYAGLMVLLDVAAGRPRGRLDHPFGVAAQPKAFSPDGRYLFTISVQRAEKPSDAGDDSKWQNVGFVWDLRPQTGYAPETRKPIPYPP